MGIGSTFFAQKHEFSDPHSRSLRLFVSSTFHDMGTERDHLVRAVFPQIRQAAWVREVAFQEVDLRWGITPQEAERGEVIELCLSEIDQCQPFFLALIGDRYGSLESTPANKLPAHLAPFAGRSVTELEIRHAAARAKAMGHSAGLAFVRTGVERSGALAALVDALPELGFKCRGYEGVMDLGAQVYDDLNALLVKRWPDTKPKPGGQAKAHLAQLRHGAVPRPQIKRQLKRALWWRRRVVLHGPLGSGMSTALASFVASAPQGRPIIFGSADLMTGGATWRDLLSQIDHFGATHPQNPSPENARPDLAARLSSFAKNGGGAIVLDGIDRLWDGIGEPDLSWLDVEPPRGTALVIATARVDVVNMLADTGWGIVHVPPMTERECQEVAQTYFAKYGKRLDPADSTRLIVAPAAKRPATLKLMLNDLRVLGDFERLGETIDRLSKVTEPEELACVVLKRLRSQLIGPETKAFDLGLPALVLSRSGIAEADLLSLLGRADDPLPFAYWRPIAAALADHMGFRDGRLELTSTVMTSAILSLLAPSQEDQDALRLDLAAQAAQSLDPNRATFEVPFQTALAGRVDLLDHFLANPDHRKRLRQDAPAELRRFAGLLADNRHSETLASALQEATEGDPEQRIAAAELLQYLGELTAAEDTLTRLGSNTQAADNHRVEALLGVAELARRRGSLPHASAALGQARSLATTTVETNILNLRIAALHIAQGSFAAAEKMLEVTDKAALPPGSQCEALRLSAQLSLTNGNLLQAQKQAEAARQTALKFAAFAEGAVAALTIAQVARRRGRYATAKRYLDEAARVFKRIGDASGTATCRHSQAVLAMDMGDFDNALSLINVPSENTEIAALGLALRVELYRRLGAQAAVIRDLAELQSRLAGLPSGTADRLRQTMAEIATEIRLEWP